MDGFLSFLRQFEEHLERWSGFGSTWLTLFLMLLVSTDVLYRAVVGKALLGVYNLSEIVMVGVCFLALAYTQNRRGHVRMELVLERLPRRARGFSEATSLLLSLIVCLLMFYRSVVELQVAIEIRLVAAGIIKWPAWPLKIVVSFGLFLLCIRLGLQFGEQIRSFMRGGRWNDF